MYNSALAPLVNPYISFTTWNASDNLGSVVGDGYDLRQANFSDRDPYFHWQIYSQFQTEGKYLLVWTLDWSHCKIPYHRALPNTTTESVTFTIAKGGQRLTW
ncbi:uncharacterized protein PG998_014396 [Apiospora kogelbergensis]|uniref:uncharacterized protein n=1 Tax=Apiospora kogelbergensis TaxID=1337665 RepID=UPI00312F837F